MVTQQEALDRLKRLGELYPNKPVRVTRMRKLSKISKGEVLYIRNNGSSRLELVEQISVSRGLLRTIRFDFSDRNNRVSFVEYANLGTYFNARSCGRVYDDVRVA
jgi:hypothetical protein